MNKQELIEYCESLKGSLNKFINGIDVNKIIKKIEQLNEPQKVTVPQFVADWIEECKNDDFHLFGAMEEMSLHQKKLDYWFREDDNMELFARAWLDGYRIEKEKRYRVNVKNIRTRQGTLNRSKKSGVFIFSNPEENNLYGTKFTRKELEEAGFGEVFNSPLFEVEEVVE